MISRTLGVAFVCATLFLAASAAAQPVRPAAGCSASTITGAYGLSFDGTDKQGVPNTSVGLLNLDGKGSFTGVVTTSKGGVIQNNAPVTGTYKVSPNCTGSGTWVSNNKTKRFNLVVISAGTEVELVDTDAGHTESGLAQSQGKPTCTNAGIKGTYGFHEAGIIQTIGPDAFIGQFKADGAGNLAGTESGSINGTIFSNVKFTGTYTVNSDCTGTASVTPQGFKTSNYNFVLIDGGLKIVVVGINANELETIQK